VTEKPPNIRNNSPNDISTLSTHENIISIIKKKFIKIDTQSSIKLAKILLEGTIVDIEVSRFKAVYESFIKKNKGKFDESEDRGETRYYLKQSVITKLSDDIEKVVDKIGASLRDIDEDDKKWELSKIDGVDAFEVTQPTTFQDVREKADVEGKNVQFRYDFSDVPKKSQFYKNKLTTQIIDVHINDSGEVFDYPLTYYYRCPICDKISKRFEYEVTSVNNKHKCTTLIPAEPKPKVCATLLSPDNTRTETKTCYIYKVSYIDGYGKDCKAEAISFIGLPRGYLQVALQKIPNSYGQTFFHIVDYRPIRKEPMELPEKKADEHYLFTLINQVDKHIYNKTQYEHYGFLPMKMAMLIQMAARYNNGFENNLNLAMTGAKSSGKSQFAKYWGLTLYAENSLVTSATSISIPKLRGTMETFTLFGKEHRFQYRGMFGEKDLIVIDELKENPDVKTNLKQYGLEVNYDYSKAGGSSQTHRRNAHIVATQNVDTKHLDKYSKDIKNLYQSDSLRLVNQDDEPKPAWDSRIDLTFGLNYYHNTYLRYAIKKIRSQYERNEINWIDGSEIALKQRFFFYFFLGSDKTSDKLNKVIRGNAMREVMADNTEITKIMDPSQFRKYFQNIEKYNKGTNDVEYFDKVDAMLDKYEKRQDARTKGMMYNMLRLIRIIDGRNHYTKADIEIFQYILEFLDNKIEIVDTAEFKIKGPYVDNTDSLVDESVSEEQQEWYDGNLGEFDE